jgi:hypothetical protein
MSAKEKATRELCELFLSVLPAMATEEQKTEVGDKVYDLVGDLLDAVAEEYHVVSKYRPTWITRGTSTAT